ncbi:hypothetical protein GQ457_07G005220 [Hibiscus cannabinus]
MNAPTNHLLVIDTPIGIVFNSRDDAWEFYKDYAKNNGFSVCRSTTRHDEHDNVKEQGFCCTRGGYNVDDSGGLHNIFWCDSTSRSDYACFNDVIAFDTTYKGNIYGWPLMPIVGVNHHNQTIVFGVAILADETANTFEWVLREFLEAMGKKPLVSVVTDGDRAMQRAIKTVFPLARHRLCSWHLSRNATANIGDKSFISAFSRCMSSWWTIEEFDREWRSVVQHFNVEDHPWVVKKD